MNCPECSAPMKWHGSLSRGKMECEGCSKSDDGKVWTIEAGMVSPTLARYFGEVKAWHRDWCAARVAVKQGKAKTTDPEFCTCGHAKDTPYGLPEIEQREVANYGMAV